MAESNVIGGNQLAESQISSQSGSLAGTTAGSVSYKETNLGGVKTFIAYFNGYENDTTTNQTITFPIAYTNAPVVIIGNSTVPTLTASTTGLTITAPNATTTYTGTVTVMGV
jgi:hypothetical protein